jgi:CheY-like chemotaxis protein
MPDLLLVDDEPGQLELRRLLFERLGHRVRTASGAGDALRMVNEAEPDVLIMDLHLPTAEEGRQLIRAMAGRNTRIVVITGWPADLEDAPERECIHRLLAKPLRWEALLDCVREGRG